MNIQTIHTAMLKRAADITVNKGDTLGGISGRTGHPVSHLMNWNNLSDANKIRAGQVLKTYPRQWRVQPGNTLSGIGKTLGYTAQQMMDANKGIKPETLQIGQFVNIPQTAIQTAQAPVQKPAVPAKTNAKGWTKDWVYPYADQVNVITKIKESRNGKALFAKGSSGRGWHHMLDAAWTDIQNAYPDKWQGKDKSVLDDEATADDAQKDYLQLIMSQRYRATGLEPGLYEGLTGLRFGRGNIDTQQAVDYWNGLLDEQGSWINQGWQFPESLRGMQPTTLEQRVALRNPVAVR